MGLPVNINDVLHGRSVEWERLKFKAGWNPEAIMHTLCAFANDFHNLGGGYLFIGIAEDKGRPVLPPSGLNASTLDTIQKQILELGYKIQPAYHPIVEPCLIQGKHVIALRAPGGQNRPYKAPETWPNGRDFHYYIRKSSCTVRARHEDEVELLSLAAQVPFDDRMNQNDLVDDLSLPLIQAHLREGGSELAEAAKDMEFDLLCRRMSLIDRPVEHRLPRNVGLMFFHDEPERFFPQTQIDVVQFPDGPGGDTIIEKTFQGPVSRQLRNALDYLRNSILEETVIKREGRAEADRFFNYPYAAIEEVLVNAAYHRSYEVWEPIEVRVLPDHITITSYPGPDRSISLSELAAGRLVARRYRNRRIGEFLKELRLTEGRGTEIPKVIRAMERNGSPVPRFDTDEDRTFFTAVLPIHSLVSKKNIQVTPQVIVLLENKKMRMLLGFCVEARDRASIQRQLHLSDTQHFRRNYLRPLLDTGLLAMTNPEHPNSPMQKYQITPLGVSVLEYYGEMTP